MHNVSVRPAAGFTCIVLWLIQGSFRVVRVTLEMKGRNKDGVTCQSRVIVVYSAVPVLTT